MADWVDVLVAGIGGAAGTAAQQAGEEVSWLRKTSLEQLAAGSGNPKGNLRQIDIDALSDIQFLRSEGLLNEEDYVSLSQNADEAAVYVHSPSVRAFLDAHREARTESARLGAGLPELLGHSAAIRGNTERSMTPSDNRARATWLRDALLMEDAQLSESLANADFSDPGEVENFLNHPLVKEFEAAQRADISLGFRDTMNLAEREGIDQGATQAASFDELGRRGWRSVDADVSTTAIDITNALTPVWQAGDVSWTRGDPIGRSANMVVGVYMRGRAQELLGEGRQQNEITNILTREAEIISTINPTEFFRDMVVSAEEGARSGTSINTSPVGAKVEELRTMLQGEDTTPGDSGTDTTVTGVDPAVDPPVEAPAFMSAPPSEGVSLDSVSTGSSVNPDGTVNIAAVGRGTTSQKAEQVQLLLLRYLQSDDPNDRSLSHARELIASMSPQERNNMPVDTYLNILMGRLFTQE